MVSSALSQAIGHRQAHVRKLMGLTQQEMADKLEVPYRTLGDNERGFSIPGGRVLAAFSALGVSVDYLLTGNGQPFQPGTDSEALNLAEQEGTIRIPIATFEPVDTFDSFIVDSTERRFRSKISISDEIARAALDSSDLGPPEALKLASFIDVSRDRMVFFDASVKAVEGDGDYLVRQKEGWSVEFIQSVTDSMLAVMHTREPSKVKTIISPNEIIVGGKITSVLRSIRGSDIQ